MLIKLVGPKYLLKVKATISVYHPRAPQACHLVTTVTEYTPLREVLRRRSLALLHFAWDQVASSRVKGPVAELL